MKIKSKRIHSIKSFLRELPLLNSVVSTVHKSLHKGRLRCYLHYIQRGHIFRWKIIKSYLGDNRVRWFQIGGGRHLKIGRQWLNGDIIAGEIYLNASKKLPFPDESIDIVFTEQFIEHLSQVQAIHFLSEAHRILKPGGIIRQSTPDMEKLVNLYLDQNEYVKLQDAVDRHIRNHRKNTPYAKASGCQFLNDMFRFWCHQFIYDKITLQNMTKEAGFSQTKWVSFGESEHDCLKNLERHADVQWMKNGFSMVCEAKKEL